MPERALRQAAGAVEHIMRKLAGGFSMEDILSAYPHLTKNQVLAALDYPANIIAHEVVIEVSHRSE